MRSARGGRWTTGSPIDASGVLVDGTAINGVASLRGVLNRYSDQFVRVVTEKLLTYALGRGIEYHDMPLVRSIVRDAAGRQLPLLVARAGHRQERSVPDEYARDPKPLNRRLVRRKEISQCSLRKSTFPAALSCAAPV